MSERSNGTWAKSGSSPGDRPSLAVPAKDPLFALIKIAIIAVVAWELLIPTFPQAARVAMERFHLRNSSFALWAAQFPVPSMYNFSNQFEMRDLPPGFIDAPFLFDPVAEQSERTWVNHFPTRKLTFSSGRYHYLRFGKDRWMTISSSYRGQTVETTIHAKPLERGKFLWVREAGK